MPFSISIAGVRNAFGEDGRVTDEGSEGALRQFATSFKGFLHDYVCPKAILEEQIRRGEASAWASGA